MIVDTHVHVVSGERDRFPLNPSPLGRAWWTEDDKDANSLIGQMDHSGVARAIAVQAVGAYGYDNSYVLDVAAAKPDRVWVVPAVDLDDHQLSNADVAKAIGVLAGTAGVVGVRLFAVAPGSEWTEQRQRARAALAAAADSGVAVVLTVFPDAIDLLRPLFEDLSELRVALDHCGFPELSEGRLPGDAPLFSLKDTAGVVLKVSSHLLREAGDAAQLLSQLADAFGQDRIMWGSDYPQTDSDYPALIDLARAACARMTEEGSAKFLGLNAPGFFAPARQS